MKKILVCIVLMTALCASLYACAGASSASSLPESTSSEAASSGEAVESTPVEITDEALLSMLWRDYIYEGYLCTQHDFASAGELDANGTAYVAYINYLQYGDGEALSRMTVPEDYYDSNEALMKNDSVYALPVEDMAREIEKRYDMEISDPTAFFSALRHTNYIGPYYLPKENAVAFRVATPQEILGDSYLDYPEPAWFGMYIEKALQYPDGHLEITLPEKSTVGNEEIITKRYVYDFIPGEDGSYRFRSCRIDYEELGLYSFEGKIQSLDSVAEHLPKQGRRSSYIHTLAAENEDSFYILSTKEERSDASATLLQILRVDKAALALSGKLEIEAALLPETFTSLNVRVYETAEGIRVCDADTVSDFDWELRQIRRTELPKIINADSYTVNADCSRWYCSDDEGLWSWSEADGKKLLVPATPGKGKLMEGVIIAPCDIRLVADDALLLYSIPGYEHINGYYMLNTADGSIAEFLREGNEYLDGYCCNPAADADTVALSFVTGINAVRLYYYRFSDGSWSELTNISDGSGLGTLMMNGETLALTNSGKTMDFTATVYDLATGASRPAGYELHTKSVDGGSYLGVLRDGRILYHYSENPDDRHLVLLG